MFAKDPLQIQEAHEVMSFLQILRKILVPYYSTRTRVHFKSFFKIMKNSLKNYQKRLQTKTGRFQIQLIQISETLNNKNLQLISVQVSKKLMKLFEDPNQVTFPAFIKAK